MNIISNIKPVIEGIACFNECVTFIQWLRSSLLPRSNGTENYYKADDVFLKEQEDDVPKLQSSLQCLRDTLLVMHNFIDQAEWRSHEKCVAKLLSGLKAASYDAEDLLEDFLCFEQKVKIESRGTEFSADDFIQGNLNKLAHIKERLDNQIMLLKAMGLHQATPRFDRSVRPETTSFPTEAKIFGRDDEIKELIRLLGVPANSSSNSRDPSTSKRKRSAIRSSASNLVCSTLGNNEGTASVPVLPVVGIGGVGKTTLAQTICNHPQVRSHFDKIVWICVSDDFDVKRLTKEAIEQFSGIASTKDSLHCLYADLSDSLNKRRFLIVLDDMWAENEELWNTFCAPFKHVLQGSMMLVTTRSQKVADIVHTMDPFALEGLRDNVLQKFFNQCVFGSDSSNNYHELKLIGEKILPNLKGSPLAAKTLGRLLRRRLEPAHWNGILNSQLWKIEQKETEILPALRLSYIYLPIRLRRCFSFCAVYPKDYNFVKEDLAEIWVAEGFVEPEHGIPLQQTACQYFEELEYLSFFQKLRGKYVMHDLIHHMAQLVSKDECFIIKDKKDLEKIPCDVRHLSVLESKDLECSDLENLCKLTKLRTLFCDMSINCTDGKAVMQKWCTKLLCLRVMVCARVSSLPDSISNMKNLQCLKILDSCNLNLLPAAICQLHNLQLLSARECRFEKVPRGFTNLINLQKFESQFLNIDAAMENGEGISLLKNFNLITRELVISNLCEISKDQAAEIELAKKEYIPILTLEWSKGTPHLPGPREHKETEVFKALHPPINIKSVSVKGYPGEFLPSWFHGSVGCTNFSSLTEIAVTGCPRLSSLEQFLQPAYMPAIKSILIFGCTNLGSVPVERFGGLPSLQALTVHYCPKINSQHLLAPSLKRLYLYDSGNLGDDIDCQSLTTFHLLSYRLASLTFKRENVLRLTELVIKFCLKLETLSGAWPTLKRLTISVCPCLNWENGILLPSSLQELELWDCGFFSVRCLENLTSLESLKMDTCKYTEYMPRELWSSNLKALKELTITRCENLVSIGGPEGIAHIPIVNIRDCPKLKEVQQPLHKGNHWL